MNKLKMLSVALACVCGLSFMSCVDDEESQSVENIRNAKAEALKAKAALDNANAEAAKLLAKADAAIKDAEAAYRQALADKENANAEQAKVELEKAKAKMEMEIEVAQMKAQAVLEAAKLQMMQNVAEYREEASANYNKAVQDVYNYTLEKIALQKSLLDAKYKLENFDVLTARNAASLKKQIAVSEAKIAEYQKMSDAGNEEIQAAYVAATAEVTRLEQEKKVANQASALAKENMDEALDALNYTAYVKAVNVLYGMGVVSRPSNENYAAKEKGEAADGREFERKVECSYLLPVDEKEVAIYINGYEPEVKAAQKAFQKVDSTYQSLKIKADSAYFRYDTAKVEANKKDLLEKYYAAKTDVEEYTSTYEGELADLEEQEEKLSKLKAAQKALATYTTTYQDAVDAMKKEADAKAKADLTITIKTYEYMVVYGRLMALTNITSTTPVATLIAQEEANIKDYNAQLSALELFYQYNYETGESEFLTEEGWEMLVAYYEQEIALCEGNIAKAQADADYYKSLIEA